MALIKLLLLLISTVAPQILDPPDDHTVVEPQDATFSCLATGRPRPDIVWTRLPDMIQLQPQPAEFIIEEQEIGDRERRSNLTIIGTQPSDAGMYACVAMNEPGTDARQATLTVHGKPDHKLIVNTAIDCQYYSIYNYLKRSGYELRSHYSIGNFTHRIVYALLQPYPTSPSLWMTVSHTLWMRVTP